MAESSVGSIHRLLSDPRLREGLVGPAPSLGTLRDLLQTPPPDTRHFSLVSDSEGVCVGALILAVRQDRLRWGSFEIVIDPVHQRCGYARQALERVPGLLEGLFGVSLIKIGVFEDNTAAMALYEALGYGPVERAWVFEPRRRRVVWMSNDPQAFERRRIGF